MDPTIIKDVLDKKHGSKMKRALKVKAYADQSTGEIYVSGDVKIIAKG